MLKFVNSIRFVVYVVGILAIGITSCTVLNAEMKERFPHTGDRKIRFDDRKDFWPPDLIPHPHLPQPEPRPDNC